MIRISSKKQESSSKVLGFKEVQFENSQFIGQKADVIPGFPEIRSFGRSISLQTEG
jgi:hypothetical protein